MSSHKQLPKLNLNLNIPDFTLMRITPPLLLSPLQISPLQFDYSSSQYEPFPMEILQKIGVKTNENNSLISSLVSGLGCMSCTACKAMSRDTLMEINSKDLQTMEKEPMKNQTHATQEEEPVDEQKKEKYQKIWKSEKKKHLRPSIVKFDVAFKQHHKLSEEQWAQKVKTFFD